MKSFDKLRKEIQEKMSKKDMKKLGVEDPLSGKGYPYNESQRFGGDTNIPADKKTKAHIESGKALIHNNVLSTLHKSARFVVIRNPNKGSNQDGYLMATISDPMKGRIKMFAYHGSHPSISGAMKFAKQHKLVPPNTMESVELDEDINKMIPGKVVAKRMMSIKSLKPYAAQIAKMKNVNMFQMLKVFVKHDEVPMKDIEKVMNESVEMDEANTGPMSDRELARWKKAYKGQKKQKRYDNLIYKFPKNSNASQFVRDIENAAIAIGNEIAGSRVEVQKLPGSKAVNNSGLAKYAKKNKGKLVKESVELDEGKTEFAVAGVGSGMFIKAFPTEKIARQYIKNTYSQKKKLRGKLGVIEVPLGADIVSNQMKRFGKIKVVKESVELDEGAKISRNPQLKIGLGKGKPAGAVGPWHTMTVKASKSAYKKLIEVISSLESFVESDYKFKTGILTLYFNKKKHTSAEHKKALEFIKSAKGATSVTESVELDEAVTTAQIKKAMFKYTTGGLTVRSAKGKMDSRYIVVRANKIDNEIRKKLLKVAYPNAKVRGGDMDNISYGNISSNIISVKAEHWAKALGLKEYDEMTYEGLAKTLKLRKFDRDERKRKKDKKKKIKKYNKMVGIPITSSVEEDIANVAGSGEVAGLGDEPPVSKGATGDIARRTSVPAPKKGDLMAPALGESVETFAGCRVFEVDDDEYLNATYGRKKWERWNKKFDMENENNKMIRTYASRNPKKPVVIKNKKTGDMSYLINKGY